MKVLFFAALRETLQHEQVELPVALPATVALIRAALCEYFPQHQQNLNAGNALAAVNQTLATEDSEINEGDEVAFFPPVTGG
ncbi:molybdopterin converting factor subunit 1 [Thalassolituus marinus]|uniref:Molybdopterin synthase sulfur carrier subunit n=1 Tax=Thalassolituus marinus TaxID=671053 RepID=A0ABS7ZKL8_9GAMM|nr:molybdopterin converting factor subunit 1 [Thalassolituus marinus]MCA6062124.1 molybdopterin converting factor subunit 1 [Thalassolituus marinus]